MLIHARGALFFIMTNLAAFSLYFFLYFEVWDLSSVSSVVYENFLKLPAPQKKLIMNPPNSNPCNNNTDFVFLILYFI